MTSFHYGTFQWKKFKSLLTSRTRSTLQSSLLAKSHLNGLFFLIQSNLSLRTPLLYGQFVWYQKSQESYIPYLYNTDSSVKWTLGSVPLVSVLKRFYCIEVFKEPRLSTHKILDLQTRFKPIETFQCTHALLILPPFKLQKGFYKRRSITSFKNQLSL